MRLMALQQRALSAGVDLEAVENITESSDPKTGVIDLIVQAESRRESADRILAGLEAGGETLFPEAQVQVKDGEAGEGMKSDAAVEVDRTGDSLVRTGLRVQPRQGMALLFYNLDPETHAPDPMAVHAALPVLRGEKQAANFWLNRR